MQNTDTDEKHQVSKIARSQPTMVFAFPLSQVEVDRLPELKAKTDEIFSRKDIEKVLCDFVVT